MGAVGLRVTGIWGDSEAWKRQTRIFLPDTQWNNKEGGEDRECWESDWVLT